MPQSSQQALNTVDELRLGRAALDEGLRGVERRLERHLEARLDALGRRLEAALGRCAYAPTRLVCFRRGIRDRREKTKRQRTSEACKRVPRISTPVGKSLPLSPSLSL